MNALRRTALLFALPILITLALSSGAFGQEAPVAASALAERFDAAARSDEALAKGRELLERARRAYREAAAIRDDVRVSVLVPGAAPQQESYRLLLAEGSDARIDLNGAVVFSEQGVVTLVPGDPPDKAVRTDIAGNLYETLRLTIPGFSLPAPQFALRSKDSLDAGDFSLDAIRDARVAGYRSSGNEEELLLAGPVENEGVILLTFDRAQSLLRRAHGSFTPEGAPPGYAIEVDVRFDPRLISGAEPRVSVSEGINISGRTIVNSVNDLVPPLPRAGGPSPEWSARTRDGSTVTLASLRGNVVVIDLWATWCAPCKRGLPHFDEFARWAAQSGDPIKVFAINTLENGSPEERMAKALEWWDQQNFQVPLLFDLEDRIFRAFGLGAIPSTIIIAPDGTIGSIHLGLSPQNPGGIVNSLKTEVTKLLPAKPQR